MKYVQNRSNWAESPQSQKTKKPLIAIGLILLAVIIGGFALLGAGDEEQVNEEYLEPAEDAELMTEEILTHAPEELELAPEQVVIESISGDQSVGGIARRGIEDGVYTHVVVADLPPLNFDTHFYEGWLVKPGVMEFFSTGELFAREDGRWGLAWERSAGDVRSDIIDFTKVVITLEPRDGDLAPAIDHVLEGEF